MKKWLLLLLCLLGFSCKDNSSEETDRRSFETVFDKEKWQKKDDSGYLFRERMLADLLASDTLKKLKKDGIIALLGQPRRTDTNYLFYTVSEKRIFVLPMNVKSLVIKLRDDGSVEWVKTHG